MNNTDVIDYLNQNTNANTNDADNMNDIIDNLNTMPTSQPKVFTETPVQAPVPHFCQQTTQEFRYPVQVASQSDPNAPAQFYQMFSDYPIQNQPVNLQSILDKIVQLAPPTQPIQPTQPLLQPLPAPTQLSVQQPPLQPQPPVQQSDHPVIDLSQKQDIEESVHTSHSRVAYKDSEQLLTKTLIQESKKSILVFILILLFTNTYFDAQIISFIPIFGNKTFLLLGKTLLISLIYFLLSVFIL